MSFLDIAFAIRIWHRFRLYKPQKISIKSILIWINQFSPDEKVLIKRAALQLKHVNQSELVDDLLERNKALLKELLNAGINLNKIIYVSISDAGSSSHAILNLLRDAGRLQNSGCKLVDAGNLGELHKLTTELKEGAVIFVDDFSGSGDQFHSQHAAIGGFIVGNFSQYFLLHTVCEEAIKRIYDTGVEVWQSQIHEKRNRPLHSASTFFTSEERKILIDCGSKYSKKHSLGYQDLATMIVYERNAPNSVPIIFRGDKKQKKLIGLVPRVDDLPPLHYL